jgi:hypothetical protein
MFEAKKFVPMQDLKPATHRPFSGFIVTKFHRSTPSTVSVVLFIFAKSVCWSRLLCGSRRASGAARLLGLRVRIPPQTWNFVSCECCALSGRVLKDGPIFRPEGSYRVCLFVSQDVIRDNNSPANTTSR